MQSANPTTLRVFIYDVNYFAFFLPDVLNVIKRQFKAKLLVSYRLIKLINASLHQP